MTDDRHNILSLYSGRCGHQWVGATCGSYACPVCGLWDGDHHLVSQEFISVQPEDWGEAWGKLAKESARLCELMGMK
jgi:hypothetical protein